MRLLLDTHALIWWYQGNERLSRAARAAIDSSDNVICVSVVSAFEMTVKARLGKLPDVAELLRDLPGYLAAQDFAVLPLSLRHAELGGALLIPHRDPFDRLLIAQAQVEGAWLVSNEALFDRFGVRRLW